MTPQDAIEAAIKLALRNHDDGLPAYIMYFDKDGIPVSSDVVAAASPTFKQGAVEAFNPTPGTGYYGHVQLRGMNTNVTTGQEFKFEIETPTMSVASSFVQPWQGAGHFRHGSIIADAASLEFLKKLASQ